MKILFLVNRYSPFIDCALGFKVSAEILDPAVCSVRYQILAYCATIGFISAEGILMIRTYAIWGRSKFILYFLVALAIGTYTPLIVLIHSSLTGYSHYALYTVVQYTTCIPLSSTNEHLWVMWGLLLIPETAVVILTVAHRYAISHRSREAAPMIHVLYRDGMLAYCTMLCTIVLNIVINVAGPPSISAIIQPPIRIIHSALCTRVLLNIRKAALSDVHSTMTSTLQFSPASPIVVEDPDERRA